MLNSSEHDSPTALALLALHANDLKLESVPNFVRRQAILCILDTIGCMIAGTRTEEARLILDCEPSDGTSAQATIPGTSERRSLDAAIRINGYLGDALELNDLIGGHASIGNVTSAVALAEITGASGAALLEAVIRGLEVTTRVYLAVYPTLKRFTEVGMVPVGIPSAIGSAAAASRLLNLSKDQTLNAMAIAGGLAGWCPAEVIFGNGGTMKPLLFGAQPGATGVTAALYAQKGMTGPEKLLDSKLGYIASSSNGGELDTSPWHDVWALRHPRRKLHACCGYLHSALDALGKLRAEIGDAIRQGAIEVHVPPYVADVVSKTAPPSSPNDARFHLQYCLALAVCGSDVILPEHSIQFQSYLDKPEVSRAIANIRVVQDVELTHYHQCAVIFDGGNGVQHKKSLSAPRGSPDEPLSDQDVINKFFLLADPVIGPSASRRFVKAIDRVEDLESTGDLMRLVAL
jgi:2-methylcitrate dehydratase PrpD